MTEKLRCPSCSATKVDTRQVRELPNGTIFRKKMPLVRFILFVPFISIMTSVSFKAALVLVALGGLTAGVAKWHNTRGIARSRPKELHACRQCGYEWRHAPGEPEPAPLSPPGPPSSPS